jgi:hypothetical protein
MDDVEKPIGTLCGVGHIHFNAPSERDTEFFEIRAEFPARVPRDVRESQWNIPWNILCIRCGPQYVATAPDDAPKKIIRSPSRECLVRILQIYDIDGFFRPTFAA